MPMKLREDVAVEHKFRREEMLANAPEVQSGCLVVPKMVEYIGGKDRDEAF